MSSVNRLASGGRIDRSQPLSFTFNGRPYTGYRGDTLASALLASGVRLFGRSIKYHRPRGLVGAGAEEPNAIVQLGEGAYTVPNQRATQIELYQGLVARTVNGWPSLHLDLYALNSLVGRLLPAGFYYKTFMWPRPMWQRYEHYIRKAAGLGHTPELPDPERYDKINQHCDVLVVGAGPAGLMAALAAGRSGARVILADEQAEFGGSLLTVNAHVGGRPAADWVAGTLHELADLPEVTLLPRATVTGYYDHNFLVINERRSHHQGPGQVDPRISRERLWRVRAAQVVLATGAIERPLVFAGNDRPGVMLAAAVSTYIRRYAVVPGRRGAVFTNNDSAYQAALDMHEAGMEVTGVIDLRQQPEGELVEAVRSLGITVYTGHAVTGTHGSHHGLWRVDLARLNATANDILAQKGALPCQVLAVSGGWNPVVHLHAQSGARPQFDEGRSCFVPASSVQAERSAGACAGVVDLGECLAAGARAGQAAAADSGWNSPGPDLPRARSPAMSQMLPCWSVPDGRAEGHGGKKFIDLQNDTTVADIFLAAREGYRSIEHVKRYTGLGFGTDQGKLGNVNGMAVLAQALGQSLADTGTTTFRPNYTPVTFGAIAGRNLGVQRFDPVRKTALHGWHVDHEAVFEDVGQWKRPRYYPCSGESMQQAVNRECLATRNSVGVLDASTLGKIDIRGPDAAEFLNRIYTNSWSKLALGRCRYGFMLGEDGMVMDDGVTARLANDHYLMTTTTGGAATVLAWMERWLQTEWPMLQVYLTSVTDHWSVMSVAGPNSRQVLEQVCAGIDLSADALPFMSFGLGQAAGIPARVSRISFSGELGFEIGVNANAGRTLWEAVMAAGRAFGITPYGTEAMHVLRAEKGYVIVGQDTDGSVTPVDLGMDWIVAKDKDFIGKRSLFRPDTLRQNRKQLVGLFSEDPARVLPEGAQLVNAPASERPVPMVGHVSSSYYSASLGRSIALALVKGGHSRMGGTVYAQLMDDTVLPATITGAAFYDPDNERQRA